MNNIDLLKTKINLDEYKVDGTTEVIKKHNELVEFLEDYLVQLQE